MEGIELRSGLENIIQLTKLKYSIRHQMWLRLCDELTRLQTKFYAPPKYLAKYLYRERLKDSPELSELGKFKIYSQTLLKTSKQKFRRKQP